VSGFLWRLVFGVLVVRALRLAVRWAPTLALWALVVACWPSVLLARLLRQRVLPAAEARWPRQRPGWWLPAGAGLLLAGLALATATGGPVWAQPAQLAAGYLLGLWVAPLAVPAGALPPGVALLLFLATAPLYVALAVVLAALWPVYGPLVRGFVRSPAVGGDGGRGPGHRSSDKPDAPVAVTLRPVPTQRIATATFGEDAWTVKPLYGPALLSMVVAPPGVGKTEIAYGSLAAAVDGLAFCGLPTTRPRRVLLLSEMEPKTIQPALLRWGFVAEASGTWQRLRLRWLRPDGSPGHLIDVVHASDAYAPDAEGRRPGWADVIRACVPQLERGRYDLLVVDSLARWMGNDSSNAAMLDALGALRQVTRMGVGVLAPHHCAKDASPPYEPRGGSAILGELDLCWSLARLPGCGDPLHDPRRVLECVKSRFAELTPPPLRIERVEADPDAPRPRYGYRLLDPQDAPRGKNVQESAQTTAGAGVDALSEQQRRVLEALAGTPGQTATTPELMAATGLERNRVQEAVLALIKARLAVVAGAGAPSPKGGRPPARYALTPWALAQLPASGGSPQEAAAPPAADVAPDPAVRLLHEALDPRPSGGAA
jgi:hypothetical protein